MTDPTVLWPVLLGLLFLVAGIFTYRRDLIAAAPRGVLGIAVLGPTFVAASLAGFAGEHFTAARSLSALVPKWLPARLFITYFVGAALMSAALSLVARKCIRWSSIGLATMFALFVLLLYLPSAIRHPTIRIVWIFPFREGTFAMGGLALYAIAIRGKWPKISDKLAAVTRVWTAVAILFYGVEHVLYPQYSPGVPDSKLTSPWVPVPLVLAYVTGVLLIVCGLAMFLRNYASNAASSAGLLMVFLTLVLYLPECFLAHDASELLTAVNFVADTLLFGGTLLVIAGQTHAHSQGGPAQN